MLRLPASGHVCPDTDRPSPRQGNCVLSPSPQGLRSPEKLLVGLWASVFPIWEIGLFGGNYWNKTEKCSVPQLLLLKHMLWATPHPAHSRNLGRAGVIISGVLKQHFPGIQEVSVVRSTLLSSFFSLGGRFCDKEG